MPTFDHRFLALMQTLDSGGVLGEPLLFPEVSCYDADPERLQRALWRRVREIVKDSPPATVYQRRLAGQPVAGQVAVELPPPERDVAWRRPVTMRFDYVTWHHGREAQIAYVPVLGIEVLVDDSRRLEEELARQIRFALVRRRVTSSLRELVRLQRCRQLSIETVSVEVHVRSPKEAARARAESAGVERSVLRDVATDLTKQHLDEAFEIERTVERLADALARRQRTSLLLVGPSGVGKTAAVHELVRRRGQFGLRHTPFWQTSGSRLIAGMSGFGMWQQRCENLVREAAKQKAVIHLQNLVELIEVGKGGGSSLGIAAFLRPYLSRGQLVAIAECTPEQIPVIEREDPQLLDVFFQVKIEEPSVEKGRSILLSSAVAAGRGKPSPIDPEALDTLDRLHRRFAPYSAYPGRPLRFLRNLLEDRRREGTITSAEVTEAFSRQTGLPLFLLDEAVPLKRSETLDWFARRVMGQPEAVQLIADLLAAVKAGLTRPGRPIASLMFVGPTGVGKTEMAKALSELIYQDPGRMVRLDMSEYADAPAVDRLIRGSLSTEGLLTRKVREQPFTVVLLDEFEKAHPALFDLLLQVLGEGRLTDASGRVADFSSAILILTSNLGSESFGRGSIGFGGSRDLRQAAEAHFVRHVRDFVRPEFFNRIDRIVPFAPLAPETIQKIAAREIDRLRSREGIRFRDVTLEVDEQTVLHLARKGYEPRYGARPLKRAIQRRLVVPLAGRLNRYAGQMAARATATMSGGHLQLAVQAKPGAAGPATDEAGRDSALVRLAGQITALRRTAQALGSSSATKNLHNEIYRLERREQQLQRSGVSPRSASRYGHLGRLSELQAMARRIDKLARDVSDLEDKTLLALYAKQPLDPLPIRGQLGALTRRLDGTVRQLFLLGAGGKDLVCVVIFGVDTSRITELAGAYLRMARDRHDRVESFALKAYRPQERGGAFRLKHRKTGKDQKPKLIADVFRLEASEDPFASVGSGVIGVGLQIKGSAVYPVLAPEQGIHVFVEGNEKTSCLVETAGSTFFNYEPPAGVDRVRFFVEQIQHQYPVRRKYDYGRETVEDMLLKKSFRSPARSIAAPLAEAVDQYFRHRIFSILEWPV